MKELKEKLTTLSKAMSAPNVDDETKRQYFTTLLLNYVNQALDELASMEQEKPILEYMANRAAGIHCLFFILKSKKTERPSWRGATSMYYCKREMRFPLGVMKYLISSPGSD